MKYCNVCGVDNVSTPFVRNRNQCKECNKKKSKQWRKDNPDKARAANRSWKQRHPERVKELAVKWNAANKDKLKAEKARNHLRRKYNLSNEAFSSLLTEQSNRCKICNREFNFLIKSLKPHVDHNHSCCSMRKTCGKCTRGLLCGTCNSAIGLLNDDPDLIQKASEYVRSYSRPNTNSQKDDY